MHNSHAPDDHGDAREINDRWSLSGLEMRLNQREPGGEDHVDGMANEAAKWPGARHRGLWG